MKLPFHRYMAFNTHLQPEAVRAELQGEIDPVGGVYALYNNTIRYQGWIKTHQGSIYFKVRRTKNYLNQGTHPGAANPVILGQVKHAPDGATITLTIRPRLDVLILMPVTWLILAFAVVSGAFYLARTLLAGQIPPIDAFVLTIFMVAWISGNRYAIELYSQEASQAEAFFKTLFSTEEISNGRESQGA